MSILSDEGRAELRQSTFESAVALADDLQRLRRLADDPNLTATDVRGTSAILRRILVEGDLSTVAAPRIGRIYLSAPDNRPYYRHNQTYRFKFFASLGLQRPQYRLGGNLVLENPLETIAVPRWTLRPHQRIKGISETVQAVSLRVGAFLSQKVICLNNAWVSREECIKFIANQKFGVHSGKGGLSQDEQILSKLMTVATVALSVKGNESVITIDPGALSSRKSRIPPRSENTIDIVSAEVFSAAYFLTGFPDVMRLEEEITLEKKFSPQAHWSLAILYLT